MKISQATFRSEAAIISLPFYAIESFFAVERELMVDVLCYVFLADFPEKLLQNPEDKASKFMAEGRTKHGTIY